MISAGTLSRPAPLSGDIVRRYHACRRPGRPHSSSRPLGSDTNAPGPLPERAVRALQEPELHKVHEYLHVLQLFVGHVLPQCRQPSIPCCSGRGFPRPGWPHMPIPFPGELHEPQLSTPAIPPYGPAQAGVQRESLTLHSYRAPGWPGQAPLVEGVLSMAS